MSHGLPPILIIMPDQMRADCMSCADHLQVTTPHIDELAAEGTRFSHGCTNSPLCMPARASFISGLYPHNHGMWHNSGQLPAGDESLFHHLQSAGYRTCHTGKSHYYPHSGQHLRDCEGYMRARGFDDVHETTGPYATMNTDSYMTDEWAEKGLLEAFKDDYRRRREVGARAAWASPLPEDDFMDGYIGRKAVEWVDEYDDARPPCLFVGFGGPHDPWDAPGRYAQMYGPAETPAAIPLTDPPEWVPDHARDRALRRRVKGLTDSDIQGIRANYYGKVSLIDDWVGNIRAAFERRGWWDDAVVVFWSDHGEMAGDFGWIHKSNFHESALRVPFILRWPARGSAGQVSDAFVETVDIMPTLLDAAGCEPSTRALGHSLAPLLDGQKSVRDATFSEVDDITMIRTRQHKYAMDRRGRGIMLYDLLADPHERVNLVGHADHECLERTLRERILGWLMDAQVRL